MYFPYLQTFLGYALCAWVFYYLENPFIFQVGLFLVTAGLAFTYAIEDNGGELPTWSCFWRGDQDPAVTDSSGDESDDPVEIEGTFVIKIYLK